MLSDLFYEITWKIYPDCKELVVNSGTDLAGEERTGFGGISREFMFPSSISITLLIVGLSCGIVWKLSLLKLILQTL